jgi:hypothetical protein
MNALQIALIIVSALIAIVELIRHRGEPLIAWGVLAIALALLLPVMRRAWIAN